MPIKLVTFLISFGFLFVSPVLAEAPIEPQISSKEEIIAYATKRAVESHLEPSTVLAVIKCESTFNPDAVGDGGNSHGLVQIHEPSHPSITREQATDPKFAIDFLVENLESGRGNMWTCYRMYKKGMI